MLNEKRGCITYRVVDQFPKDMHDRRRIHIPYMVAARSRGKQAPLVGNNHYMYIKNTLYTANKLPSEIPPRRPYIRDCRRTTEHPSSRRPPAGRPPPTVASDVTHHAANDTTDGLSDG